MLQSNQQKLLNHIGVGIAFYITMLSVVGTFSILFRTIVRISVESAIIAAVSTELFSILLMMFCAILFKVQLRKYDFSKIQSLKKMGLVLLLIWIISNLIQAFIVPELVFQLIQLRSVKSITSSVDEFYSILINLSGNLARILIIVTLFFNFKTVPPDDSEVS
jgi:hypothetical protein